MPRSRDVSSGTLSVSSSSRDFESRPVSLRIANTPSREFSAANSTADAARLVAESDRADLASIGTLHAARLYGLEVLASEIEDHPENETRFVLVGRGVRAERGSTVADASLLRL